MAAIIKILHSEPMDYSPAAKTILESFAKVDYLDISRSKIMRRIAGYDALIVRLRNAVDARMIALARRLKAIATATTGTNHIDEAAARRYRIQVISLKGETEFLKSVHSTAEHTFGLILSLLRKIPSAQNDVFSGRWRCDQFRGYELFGKTLGIIGFGRLGRMVAGIASGFDMKVLAYDHDTRKKYSRDVPFINLEELLARSDVVTLHIPLNEETKNFMNRDRLSRMKRGAFLINTSRGQVIDEKALLGLLKKRHLAGAAVDVLSGEEQLGFKVSSHPLVLYARIHENVIITPHIGGAALEAVEKTDVFIAKKLREYFTQNGTYAG